MSRTAREVNLSTRAARERLKPSGKPYYRSLDQGFLFAMIGDASDAAEMLTSGITARRSTGYTLEMPWWLSQLAVAHVDLDQLDDAQRCIDEALDAIEKTKERWCEAEAYRLAGVIALLSPERETAKAQTYFERALSAARQQQAKSWELRAAMSLARLWRSQGKVSASARSVGSGLSVVYGGVRYARSEGGEGAAPYIGSVI